MASRTRTAGVIAGAALLVAGIGTAGAVALRSSAPSATAAEQAPSSAQSPPTAPVTLVAASAGADGAQPWDAPLRIGAQSGELQQVTVTGPDDTSVAGSVVSGVWTSTGALYPSTTYRVTATARDQAGHDVKRPLVVRTTDPKQVLRATLDPGDGNVVGVGLPVAVHLNAGVPAASRAAVVQRLAVTTTPAVEGAWHWTSDREVHWRPAQFWAPGTKVEVKSDLSRLALPGGVWGDGVHTSSFRIGDAVVSTADVGAHTLTVTRNGQVLRVLKASMGKPGRDTRNGVDLVLEKNRSIVMDSDTVGMPGEYKTKVDWAVRLTYSGTFTHSAPWSVADQGVRNVSHGCVNLAPADAEWFYGLVKRGDVVQVVGSPVAPLPYDPGSADWNMPFEQWKQG